MRIWSLTPYSPCGSPCMICGVAIAICWMICRRSKRRITDRLHGCMQGLLEYYSYMCLRHAENLALQERRAMLLQRNAIQ